MSKILCIETSSTNCSVAVYKNNTLISLKEDNDKGYSHAENLHVFIEAVLQDAEIKKMDLDAIAVSKGPGSYTGLRIGVSTAKGLCYALDIPLISINTLESLAQQTSNEEGYIIPMLDARRMEVYTMILNNKHQILEKTSAKILDENSYSKYLEKGKCYFLGNGSNKFSEIIDHPNAIFIDDKIPSAKEIGLLAINSFSNSTFEDVAYFEPFYLKDFQTTPPRKK